MGPRVFQKSFGENTFSVFLWLFETLVYSFLCLLTCGFEARAHVSIYFVPPRWPSAQRIASCQYLFFPPKVSKPPTNSVRGRVTSKQAYTHARYTCQYIIFRPPGVQAPSEQRSWQRNFGPGMYTRQYLFVRPQVSKPPTNSVPNYVFWFLEDLKLWIIVFFCFLELWIIGWLDYCL